MQATSYRSYLCQGCLCRWCKAQGNCWISSNISKKCPQSAESLLCHTLSQPLRQEQKCWRLSPWVVRVQLQRCRRVLGNHRGHKCWIHFQVLQRKEDVQAHHISSCMHLSYSLAIYVRSCSSWLARLVCTVSKRKSFKECSHDMRDSSLGQLSSKSYRKSPDKCDLGPRDIEWDTLEATKSPIIKGALLQDTLVYWITKNGQKNVFIMAKATLKVSLWTGIYYI